jgi:hypothetical protein
MDKIIQRHLKVGQWKLQLSHEISGHMVSGVYLKGNRGRPWKIYAVSEEEFLKRFPVDQADASVLRGIPSMWTVRGSLLYLWPSPANEWVLEIRMIKREKEVA